MAAPTFNYTPHEGAGGTEYAPRVNVAKMGDGYEQRSQQGIVADDETYQFMVENEDLATLDTMIAFLRGLNSVNPFYFTPPGGTSQLWVQQGKLKKTNEKPNSANLSVTFMRYHGAEE